MAAIAKEHVAPIVCSDDVTALHRVVENFDKNQLIWCSGYLAGLSGAIAPSATAP